MSHRVEMTGKVFGRLTVMAPAGRVKFKGGQSQLIWLCRCTCGSEKTYQGNCLRSGNTTSCGCYESEMTSARNRTHGKSKSREYNTWCGMKDRCFNPNNHAWDRYGGRGITLCQRWNDSFEAFLEDMGKCPKNCTIDRINPNGNYEPANCRWATSIQQARNKRNSSVTFWNGGVLSLRDIADTVRIPANELYNLTCYQNKSIYEAVAILSGEH